MSTHNNGSSIEILLVEDNPGDVRLTREALKASRVSNHLNVVGDGVEAMAFLRQKDPYTTASRPDLILLDLNLPRKGGHEVLAEIKKDPYLKQIPVVILTSSSHNEDILRAYENYANCYITKPVDFEEFITVVMILEDFWLRLAKLPTKIDGTPSQSALQPAGGGKWSGEMV